MKIFTQWNVKRNEKFQVTDTLQVLKNYKYLNLTNYLSLC